MTDLAVYQAPEPALPAYDSWVTVLAQVGDLASKISGTDFVPDAMKGKPAAVAAAILTGREMGIGPMASLQNIHLIKGKPGMSANLMRQLILQAGHELRYVETTDTRCVVEGRRRGTEDWTRVTFNADQARKAKIDLGTYPEDKLVARATSRLARRVFADCLGGMPYLAEEAAEGASEGEHVEVTTTVAAGPVKRTAKRAQAVPAAKTSVIRGDAPTAPATVADRPPLPGDDIVDADLVDEAVAAEPPAEELLGDDPDAVTNAQLKALAAALSFLGINDRKDRLDVCAALAARGALSSSKELTKADASIVLDTLRRVSALPDPEAALAALIGLGDVDRSFIEGQLVDLEQAP